MPKPEFHIRRIGADEPMLMERVLDAFAEAFDDTAHYSSKRPAHDYLARLLRSEHFVCLAALHGDRVIGALTAYELVKYEQERSEMYIYDLAVLEGFRRIGVATQLIETLKPIAASRGASVIFVQADREDDPAIALYTGLGRREEVLHFDIATGPEPSDEA